MTRSITASPAHGDDRQSESESAWAIVQAAADAADELADTDQLAAFALARDGTLVTVPIGDPAAVLIWRPGAGWEPAVPASDSRRAIVELYLPVCSATAMRPVTIGHVGQSLDGFIAMQSGESHWITGEQNILHMHRLRALCDAVVVGAGTVAADDPQLTTRLVAGSSPLRVVIDPARRLPPDHRVFTDATADTLYVCARSLISDEKLFGQAAILGVAGDANGIDVVELMRHLRARGCRRVFVEGGGVTVSMFLDANLLDRLHITVAPLLIGDGRPAIRFPPRIALGDCPRPSYRVFRMGGDVLFDCDFAAPAPAGEHPDTDPVVARVI
jgi:riboflavin-specific deaminase-like protein